MANTEDAPGCQRLMRGLNTNLGDGWEHGAIVPDPHANYGADSNTELYGVQQVLINYPNRRRRFYVTNTDARVF
jgi:hypothetical protein